MHTYIIEQGCHNKYLIIAFVFKVSLWALVQPASVCMRPCVSGPCNNTQTHIQKQINDQRNMNHIDVGCYKHFTGELTTHAFSLWTDLLPDPGQTLSERDKTTQIHACILFPVKWSCSKFTRCTQDFAESLQQILTSLLQWRTNFLNLAVNTCCRDPVHVLPVAETLYTFCRMHAHSWTRPQLVSDWQHTLIHLEISDSLDPC